MKDDLNLTQSNEVIVTRAMVSFAGGRQSSELRGFPLEYSVMVKGGGGETFPYRISG